VRAQVRALASFSISEAQHSGDRPMAGHNYTHLPSTAHQQQLETCPTVSIKQCLVDLSSRRKMSATNIFVLGEFKTIASDYLQSLKIMRSLTHSEKQQSKLYKAFSY